MKLSELLSQYMTLSDSQDVEISEICLSSVDVVAGAMFFAYPGEKADGRDFIPEAIKKGARAIISECPDSFHDGAIQPANADRPMIIYFKEVQKKIGVIAQKFFDYPAKNIKIIGITGTSGKTSVANIIAQSLNLLGGNAYVMGTFGVGKPQGPFIETGINTPDPIELQRHLVYLKKQNCDVLVMEVSSHALIQGRVQGFVFDIAIFTNLTQDHLDYHKTMEEYGRAKERLLTEHRVYHAIFNRDDPWAHRLYDRHKNSSVICSEFSLKECAINLHDTQLIGEFNQYNLLAAMSCLAILGYSQKEFVNILPNIRPIPGRLERVYANDLPCCIIDYAHKPDALEKALVAVRQMTKGQVFCVFGCGGDRDKSKRPLMGAIAERYADHICLTDDNPRTENSANILADILAGIQNKSRVRVIYNREEAIRSTIALASPNDVILIAGKGHEHYQIIGTEKKHFSDREIVEKIIH